MSDNYDESDPYNGEDFDELLDKGQIAISIDRDGAYKHFTIRVVSRKDFHGIRRSGTESVDGLRTLIHPSDDANPQQENADETKPPRAG